MPLSRLDFRPAWRCGRPSTSSPPPGSRALLAGVIREREPDWRAWGLVPLMLLLSCPFYLAVTHGQSSCVSLLLVTIIALAWRARRAVLAGVGVALLAYKPQLAAVVGVVLVLDLGWRAAAAIAGGGGVLLLATLLTLPGALSDYLHRLPQNLRVFQVERPYYWERHVTLRAFWRLLFQGHAVGETAWVATILSAVCCAALVAGLIVLVRRLKRADDSDAKPRRDVLIAATLVATPLLMPFFFDYDLLLLAVPAVLYAAGRVGRDRLAAASDRWLTVAWCSLFLLLFVNPNVAAATRVNGAVVVLSTIAIISFRKLRTAPHSATSASPVFAAPLRPAA